jgi:hypothetical protein
MSLRKVFAASALKPEWIRTIEAETSNTASEGFGVGWGVALVTFVLIKVLF